MTDRRRSTGQLGELLAVDFLTAKGYTIHDRNWRCARGELDIVARIADELVFVEVRTRRGGQPGQAEASVTVAKQQRLAGLAELYLAHLADTGTAWPGPWRIDVVAVHLDGRGEATINHIPDALEGAYQ